MKLSNRTFTSLLWLQSFVSVLGFLSFKRVQNTATANSCQGREPVSIVASTSEKSDNEDKVQPQRVLVVGGGVGGLAVASRIAAASTSQQPFEVTLLEKNAVVGGRCGSFSRTVPGIGAFRHERGPSLLLLPQIYKDVFTECSNQPMESFGLEIKQCIPAYQVVFEDGDTIDVGFPRQPNESTSKREEASRQKMNLYEQDGARKWDDYLRATSAYLDAGLPNFIEERLDLSSLPNFLVEALRDFARAWPLKPHSDVLDAIFESDKMKALASFQDLYVGLEPYRNNELLGGGVLKSTAPAVFGLLAAIELHPSNDKAGVFAPVGGFQAVTDALESLASSVGVKIHCESLVTRVQSDGVYVQPVDNEKDAQPTFVPADLVVVNADLPYATKSLLQGNIQPTEPIFDWDDQFTFSSGVICFHWSLDMEVNDLNTHNVFLMGGSRSQAELGWKVLRDNAGEVSPGVPFNFYVHRPSHTDPTAVPASGCDSIMVLVPCRTLLRDEDCSAMPRDEAMRQYREQFSDETISLAKQAVLERLSVLDSLKNLEEHIVDEVVDTPATWAEQFHLGAGTPFALSHGFAQLSLTRPSPRYRGGEKPNIWFCGASTRPGNGVPLVLTGAKQVGEKVVQSLQEQVER